MKIGVYGSASGIISSIVQDHAKEMGRLIAERGHTLITGACSGIPLDAARAAHAAGGTVIGYSPARNLEEHKRWGVPTASHTEFVFVPSSYEYAGNPDICRKYRNISSVAASDAAVFIAGQYGALNEFTLAYDFGKPIGVILGTSGIADLLQGIVDKIQKEPRPFMIFSKEPMEVVKGLEAV